MLFKYIPVSCLVATCLHSLNVSSQNLIHDPGFEMVYRIFDGTDTTYVYDSWASLTTFKKKSPEGLPLYSDYRKRNRNSRYLHYWSPYEGNSLMYSHVVYLRNLYQTKLLKPLQPGKNYKISFKYKILSDGFSKEKIQTSVNEKIGILLTNTDMTDSTGLNIIKNNNISLRPQFVINSFDADNISKWLDFTSYFESDRTYQYFIIGNFIKLIDSYQLKNYPITGISYRIDHVSIELVDIDMHEPLIKAEKQKRLKQNKNDQ